MCPINSSRACLECGEVHFDDVLHVEDEDGVLRRRRRGFVDAVAQRLDGRKVDVAAEPHHHLLLLARVAQLRQLSAETVTVTMNTESVNINAFLIPAFLTSRLENPSHQCHPSRLRSQSGS